MPFEKYLESDEQVLYVVHRHIYTIFLMLVFKIIFFIGIPTGFYMWYVSSLQGTFSFLENVSNIYIMIGSVLFMFFGFLNIAYNYADWYYDVFILTNKDLISLNWKGIFNKEVVRLDYRDLESVQANTKGVSQSIFHFGRLEVESANEVTDIIMKDARKPLEAQQNILKMKDYMRQVEYQKQAQYHQQYNQKQGQINNPQSPIQ